MDRPQLFFNFSQKTEDGRLCHGHFAGYNPAVWLALATCGFRPHRVVMVIHKPLGDDRTIYSPEEIQKLVSYLWEKRGQTTAQSALLYVVLGAFAGLRPAEASSLDWKAIDFTTNEIRLTAALPKVARVVPIPLNLLAFLQPYKSRKGRIVIHEKVTNLLRRYCEEAGVKHIPNGLRRSYAAYRLVETGPEAIQAEMGGPTILTEIKPLKTPTAALAKQYWAILP
jgi:integrase